MVAVVDSGGGCIDTGGGVRWWCGHINDRGGGWCHAPNTFGTVNMEHTIELSLSWSK